MVGSPVAPTIGESAKRGVVSVDNLRLDGVILSAGVPLLNRSSSI